MIFDKYNLNLAGAYRVAAGLEINEEWVKTPAAPTEFELNAIRNDPVRLATIRLRLSDLSWWMRLLCQYIAMRANGEDGKGLI